MHVLFKKRKRGTDELQRDEVPLKTRKRAANPMDTQLGTVLLIPGSHIVHARKQPIERRPRNVARQANLGHADLGESLPVSFKNTQKG